MLLFRSVIPATLFFVTLSATSVLGAQQQLPSGRLGAAPAASAETPEGVAARYMTALKAGDYAACARVMHPEALIELRRLFAPIIAKDKAGRVSQQLFGATPAQFATLGDAMLLERLLRNSMTGQGQQAAAAAAVLKSAQITPLGHVKEGADMAHVLMRAQFVIQGLPVTRMDVMSMQRTGTAWRATLPADVRNLAGALARQAGP